MSSGQLRVIAALVLLPFTVLTVQAIVSDGSNGFPAAITYNLWSLQIWLDLVIVMVFWCAWVFNDARLAGRNPWGWIVAALLFGAFSPLIYMLVHQRWPASGMAESPGSASSAQRRLVGGLVLAAFSALTIAAFFVDGSNVVATVTHSWSNIQIWVDLVIVILLWIPWMLLDARSEGRNPWGWVVFALALGAFAPLVYLTVYGRWPASHGQVAKSS